MNKFMLSASALLISISSFAYAAGDDERKNTIELHGKGSANSTFLFNKNISDSGNMQDYAAGWSFNYGAGVSMYFGKVGFGVEGLFGNHRGAYAGSLETVNSSGNITTTEYSSNINLKVVQIPVFFKLKSEMGGYLELGPQYTMITEANYHFTTDGSQTDTVMTDAFAKSYFSGVLGVGFKIPIAKSRIAILGGIRLQYSLTDIKGVDALGYDFRNFFQYKNGPEKTSAATGGFMLGVVYTIGEKKKEKSSG